LPAQLYPGAGKAQTAEPGGAIYQTLTGLFIAAVGLLVAGYCWSLSFPVNKKIWTSSYVLVTTGLALAVLATLIYAIEVKGTRNRVARFFDVFGKNALFVFALSAFLPKGLRLLRLPNGVDAAGAPLYLSPWNWCTKRCIGLCPAHRSWVHCCLPSP
jgi:predicted acyltransferase